MSILDTGFASQLSDLSSHPNQIYRLWNIFSRVPGGKWTFSKLLGTIAPYTGSISARVDELEPGRSKVILKEHRAVRNHLSSIHAIALANLSELTANLALLAGLPSNARIIITEISVEYHKKSRGRITAHGDAPIFGSAKKRETTVEATIRDEEGDITSTATIESRIGPA